MERMSTPELEEEKRQGPRNRGIEAIKVSAVQGGRMQEGSQLGTDRVLHVPAGPGEGAEELGGPAAGDH